MLLMFVFAIPAFFLRYVILKRPLGLAASFGISFVFFLLAVAFQTYLAQNEILRLNQSVVPGSSVLTFIMLFTGSKKAAQSPPNNPT